MAKRERYTCPVTCPQCGKKGAATWTENENPVYGDGLQTRLEDYPAGFYASDKVGNDGARILMCGTCNVPVD